MGIRSIAATGALVLAGIPAAIAGNLPTGSINPITFTQSSFNFNGVDTTIVGHLNLTLSVSDPFFDSLLVEGITPIGLPPTTITLGAPFATRFQFTQSTPGCGALGFGVSCTFSGDITFVGPGNVYNGGVFGARATLFWDNGSLDSDGLESHQLDQKTASFNAVEPRSNVPEPWTVALLGAGLAGLGLAKRRAKH